MHLHYNVIYFNGRLEVPTELRDADIAMDEVRYCVLFDAGDAQGDDDLFHVLLGEGGGGVGEEGREVAAGDGFGDLRVFQEVDLAHF
jgi:hypothetical protein